MVETVWTVKNCNYDSVVLNRRTMAETKDIIMMSDPSNISTVVYSFNPPKNIQIIKMVSKKVFIDICFLSFEYKAVDGRIEISASIARMSPNLNLLLESKISTL